jgi:formate C-acetyltransferase
MWTLSQARQRMEELATPAWVYAELQALAALLRLHPRLKHHLVARHPAGLTLPFNAGFQFSTRDGAMNVHLLFRDGGISVGLGTLDRPDLVVRCKTPAHLRAFFSADSDLFGLLLRNDISFEGNLSYLARFGHISADVRGVGKRRHPERPWSRGPARWQDLAAPPAGEPCAPAPGEAQYLADIALATTTLDDLPRIKQQLWAFRTTQPEVCTERPRLLTEFMVAERLRPGGADWGRRQEPGAVALRQARALAHVLGHRRPIIHDDDLLAGTTTSKRVGVIVYPELGGTMLWPELLTVERRELNPYRIADEDITVLDQQVFPFWMEDNVREWARRENQQPYQLALDERFVLYFMWKTNAVSHTIADLPLVLRRGLQAVRDEATARAAAAPDPQRRDYYRALAVALDGVMAYASHLAAHAEQLADALPANGAPTAARRAELRELARVLRRVPAGPATTLHEALQSIWLVFLALHQESMNAGLSVGRLDTWLQPYLEHDLAAVAPDDRDRAIRRALELTCAFMLKLTDHLPTVPDIGNRLFGGSSSDQVITLGGVKPDGTSAVCDMTFILLKATEMLRLRDPNMNARYAPGVNSPAYLRRLCEVNLLTRATPSLHNDDVVVKSLVNQGFALEDARDWGATGCVEPTSCGRHYGHTNCMMLNLVAPLEMALHDGVHPLLADQVGPKTGDPARFPSYADFLAAYETQLGWLIDRSVECNNLLGRGHQAQKPTPLLSSLIAGPMERGIDLIDGGARYNSSGTAMVGLTDVVDSLCVVKTLVFERQRVTLARLLAALEADFVGHEALLAEIQHKVPRFGQDDPTTRAIANRVIDFVYDRFGAHRNYRGGRYVPGYWSMSNHVAFGILSGALPSGRRRGQPFTPGLTPAPGSGAPLTQQIRTVAALDPLKLPNNIAFNCKLVPGGGDRHGVAVDRMAAYVAAYCELGGMQIQFNVVSTETLKDAMARPDEYRDLLVRISGYNAYFVELNRDLQLELCARTEHALAERA